MRRAIRIDKSADLLRPRGAASRPSPYLCSSCTYKASSFSTSSSRPADKKLPLTEKLRRRIWGTDQPPGQENPYEKIKPGERVRRQDREEEAAQRQNSKGELKTMADVDPAYVPATSWEGLESVGGFGHWWKQNWDAEHQFNGFLPRSKSTDRNAITAALRRAMVEVFALREAGIPLSEVSKAISEWDPTSSVQILPAIAGASLHFSPAASLDEVIQSLAPATTETDETAVKENPSESEADVAADRSTVDPLHPDSSVEVDETVEKGNPSESEADVAADRSTVDPLHPHSSAEVDETVAKGNPSESEADVAADRSTVDPLHHESLQSDKSASIQATGGPDVSESWDPAWLEVSFEDPEVKFAVSNSNLEQSTPS
jgi:hypothetical protein